MSNPLPDESAPAQPEHVDGRRHDADVTPPAPEDRQPAGLDSRGRVRRTRASGLWVGTIVVAVIGVLFLIFIAQNSDRVTIHFLGWDGRISLAIALLLSAAIGILVVAIPGAVRITQLRHALRKNASG